MIGGVEIKGALQEIGREGAWIDPASSMLGKKCGMNALSMSIFDYVRRDQHGQRLPSRSPIVPRRPSFGTP